MPINRNARSFFGSVGKSAVKKAMQNPWDEDDFLPLETEAFYEHDPFFFVAGRAFKSNLFAFNVSRPTLSSYDHQRVPSVRFGIA